MFTGGPDGAVSAVLDRRQTLAPTPTELSAETQQLYLVYGLSPGTVIAVVEVCPEREGCPEAEQLAEYRVTAAEGGTEGEGGDQESRREVAVVIDTPRLIGSPGGAIEQCILASSL
jgi:hypothetical protein